MSNQSGDSGMKKSSIRIDFSLVPGKPGIFIERAAFWDSPTTAQWFKDRGYILYRRLEDENYDIGFDSVPSIAPTAWGQAEYPYAHYDLESSDEVPLRVSDTEVHESEALKLSISGKVFFAQDSLNRHVAIKIVRADTDELKIFDFLKLQSLATLEENCVIPVLDILPADGFSFVVTPRWGTLVETPFPQRLRGAMTMIHSMLKGLNFLHKHNIAHRDIKAGNFLVNHFGDDYRLSGSTVRDDLRSKGLLSYALFDFDHSVMLPPEGDRTQYRLPYYESWGTINVVTDTAQGEHDFNPFVFDVGALGRLFCVRFQHLSREIPIFAPFLDKLTTRKLESRFTAAEALHFFEEVMLQSLKTELDRPIDPEDPTMLGYPYYEYDRWATVPSDFAKKWAHCREPLLPWTIRLLRKICRTSWGCHNVPRIRLFFFRSFVFLRRLTSCFFGLQAKK
ncbi:hypothetical protein CVT25_009422 [Psilocybe cyanescens]|uniref:Protein kinase domain-containing protein n=1 Tax=Psilocybe cyanescens TaxID=93625 RepID=A0A409WW13_PSICY|nr:hypothetical protein CVT25_009422 [Psilocybe cyanescens]